MICDMSEVHMPLKYLRDVQPTEVFSWSPNGRAFTRVCMNSDWSKFIVMGLDMHECFEPKEEDMEKQVYMLKAVIKITRYEKEKKGS